MNGLPPFRRIIHVLEHTMHTPAHHLSSLAPPSIIHLIYLHIYYSAWANGVKLLCQQIYVPLVCAREGSTWGTLLYTFGMCERALINNSTQLTVAAFPLNILYSSSKLGHFLSSRTRLLRIVGGKWVYILFIYLDFSAFLS